ncbi:MAG: energy-coupling factor transporter ATPase [Chloroflexi bacterium]|jgi:energy-coupling factor transport system ATP-binding protein|nr:energy-coupling factor transporter ATPase [Chloroflexota bacterium]
MSIELSRVSYTYSPGTVFETVALQEINLTIEDGEYLGLMGKTGCGKSTLLQLMVGLMQPSRGQIFVDGKDINGRDYVRAELRRKIGMVFQYPEIQLFETSVEKDVAFGLKHSGLSKAEAADNVRWAIEIVGLDYDKIRSVSPFSLSGGEKRRVAIAGILAAKPKILILDEPIAGLDPKGRDAFLDLTQKLNADGVTIIMVSHNADALSKYASRIIILDSGRLALDSPSKDAFKDLARLETLGVGVSQAREVAHLLSQCGFQTPADIIRYEELQPLLLSIARGGHL